MSSKFRDVWLKYTGLTWKMTVLREGGGTIENTGIFCKNDGKN
jgi:hypothetical protein